MNTTSPLCVLPNDTLTRKPRGPREVGRRVHRPIKKGGRRLTALAFAGACLTTALTGCGGPLRGIDGLILLPKIRPPAEAVEDAKVIEDAAFASEVAWLEGNDRALARRRLDRGLEANPLKRDLLLRRALLSLEELRDQDALEDLLAIIASAPDAPSADVALTLLHDELSRFLTWRSRIRTCLSEDGFFAVTKRPSRVTLATAIMARVEALDRNDAAHSAHLERGGWLRSFEVTGPLTPPLSPLLGLAEEVAQSRAADPTPLAQPSAFAFPLPVRRIQAYAQDLYLTAGDQPGTYALRTYFRIDGAGGSAASRTAIVIEAHIPTRGTVYLDGQMIATRKHAVRRGEGRHEAWVELEPGWHQLSLALVANNQTTPSISVLSADGRPVVAEVSITQPTAVEPAAPGFVHREKAYDLDGRAKEILNPLLDAPSRAYFGRILAARLAMTTWNDAFEQARRYMPSLLADASSSALLLVSQSRLLKALGLPNGLVQARLQAAIALDPDNPAALVEEAQFLADDAPDEALKLARKVGADTQSAAPLEIMFRIFRQRGWETEADAALKDALSIQPTAALVEDAAQFYRALDRYAEMHRVQGMALRLAEPGPAQQAARAAFARGDLEAADQALEAAVRTDPFPADRISDRASLALTRGQTEEAIARAHEALSLDPLHRGALSVAATSASKEIEADASARANANANANAGGDADGSGSGSGSGGGGGGGASAQDGGKNQDARSRADPYFERLRALGSSVKLETFIAALEGRTPGCPAPGTAFSEKLAFDPWLFIRPTRGSLFPRGLDPLDRWSRHKSVEILDRVVDWVQPTGRALSMRHQITRLQSKDAADRLGELGLGGEDLPLLMRTLKPNGRTLEVDRHDGKSDLSFSALGPGDAVERQYVTMDEASSILGGYRRTFAFQSTSPIIRSELAVVIPKALVKTLWFHGYNGAPAPEVLEEGENVVYLWRAEEVPALEAERFATPFDEFLPFVVVTVGLSPDDALRANRLRSPPLDPPTWTVRAEARSITQQEETPTDKAEALFRWIIHEIGEGVERDPDAILLTKRGFRTGLFLSMLDALGIEASLILAEPVAPSMTGPMYPAPDRFFIPWVRIEGDAREARNEATAQSGVQPIYVNLDNGPPWFGGAPPDMEGAGYLVAGDDKTDASVRVLSPADIQADDLVSEVELTVDTEGTAVGRIALVIPPAQASEVRRYLQQARNSEIDRFVQGWVSTLFAGARTLSWSTEDRDDILLPLKLKARVQVEHFMLKDAGYLVAEQFFDTPIALSSLGLPMLKTYLQTSERKTPLLLRSARETMSVSIRLPRSVGIPVETPKSLSVDSTYGEFRQTFAWDPEDKVGHMERTYRVDPQRISVEAFPTFRNAAQDLTQNMQSRFIVPIDLATTHLSETTAPHSGRPRS
ncbi:MAG: DUF3857 domain-containing protein [Deltaproteobacteria bacterium]|nr:DUF3857 domain-containing protein [Deltaproteobacteria bacterium]